MVKIQPHNTLVDRPPLLGLSFTQLSKTLGGSGRAAAVWKQLRNGEDPFLVSPPYIQNTLPTFFTVEQTSRSPCGTSKLLCRLSDHHAVELVLIPNKNRTTLCLSTQVGCARGCNFCMTATMGLKRSLSVSEIIAQVVTAVSKIKTLQLPPLRNIVFMGMGEPLDNLNAVEASLHIITHMKMLKFGKRHVTVSTVGSSPKAILRTVNWPCRLAWSLHIANDSERRLLILHNKFSLQELYQAFYEVMAQRNEPLFIEITLIAKINDTVAHAQQVIAFFANFPSEVRFNLLPVNRGRDGIHPSDKSNVQRFQQVIRDAGYFCMQRTPRGEEHNAACGQLAISV